MHFIFVRELQIKSATLGRKAWTFKIGKDFNLVSFKKLETHIIQSKDWLQRSFCEMYFESIPPWLQDLNNLKIQILIVYANKVCYG